MASTEKLPSGRWRGRYVDADGRKRAVPGTFPRKSDARDAAIEAQAKAKRTVAAATGTLSARTPWRDWWTLITEPPADEDDSVPRLVYNSDWTLKVQNNVDKHVEPRWGDTPLIGFKRREVQAWLDGLCRKGYSPNYVRAIYQPLQRSINLAVASDILDGSPLVGIELPKRPKRAKRFVEVGEPAKLEMHERYVDAADFALEVGCRPGELAGLHAAEVDSDTGWVEIVHAYLQKVRKIRPTPKDKDARRAPLSGKAIEIVRRQLAGRDLTEGCGVEHTDGAVCSSPLVFLNLAGGVLNPDLLSRHLRESARELGMKPKSGYALRRGFATRAIEGGADVFAVQRVMGHADLDELAGYVQETTAARAKMLAALGERPELAAVADVGPRGTERGTDSDNQPFPETPTGDETNTG